MALLEGFVRLLEGRGESLRRPERVRQRASAEDVPQQGHSLRLGEMIKTIGISLIIALPNEAVFQKLQKLQKLALICVERGAQGQGLRLVERQHLTLATTQRANLSGRQVDADAAATLGCSGSARLHY